MQQLHGFDELRNYQWLVQKRTEYNCCNTLIVRIFV
jgi:hypothetical protein